MVRKFVSIGALANGLVCIIVAAEVGKKVHQWAQGTVKPVHIPKGIWT